MSVIRHVFVRDFLASFYEHRFVSGLISEEEYFRYHSALVSDDFERFSRDLFSKSPAPLEIPGCGVIRLVHLREMDGSKFPFLLALPDPQHKQRSLKCFVGHRFIKKIEGPLRFNLAHVLNPHRIELKWSAQDLSATNMFSEIVEGIRESDMCFFDNYGTAGNPNVFIEVGIACALRVPMIVTEYTGGSSAGTSVMPSDLQGLFRIRYSSYKELFRKLYFGLPNFMAKNRITSGRASSSKRAG